MIPNAGFDGYEKFHPWIRFPKRPTISKKKQGIIFLNSIVMVASYCLCGEQWVVNITYIHVSL